MQEADVSVLGELLKPCPFAWETVRCKCLCEGLAVAAHFYALVKNAMRTVGDGISDSGTPRTLMHQ
jgi:hypothetical protein